MSPVTKPLLLFGMLIYLSLPLSSQILPKDRDTLDLYCRSKDWDKLIHKLNRTQKEIKIGAFYPAIRSELIAYLYELKAGGANRIQLRKAHMYYARRCENEEDFNEAIKHYLIAHSYVDDPFCLDSAWTWYVENPLSVCYNRIGDVENGLYFSILTEISLEYFGLHEQLSRLYSNQAKLYEEHEDHREKLNSYLKGYQLSKKINYPQGIFANAIGAGESFLYLDSLKLVESFLNEANGQFNGALPKKYEENKILYHQLAAKFYTKLKQYPLSSRHYLEALGCRSDSTADREYSKLCNEWALMLIASNQLDKAKELLLKGISNFLPNVLKLESPQDSYAMSKENTFAELFHTSSLYFEKKYHQDSSLKSLENSIDYLKLGMLVYNYMQDSIMADKSKLLIVKDTRNMVDQGIRLIWEWQRRQGQTPITMELARSFFNSSKALLLDEKMRHHATYNSMTHSDKMRLSALEKEILKIRNQMSLTNLDQRFIQLHLIKYTQQYTSLLNNYSVKTSNITYPENYIEYHVQNEGVFTFAKLNQHEYFIRLGEVKLLNDIQSQLSSCFEREGKLDCTESLRAAYDFLLGPFQQNIPKNLCIIPDGSIQLLPFDALVGPDSTYLLEKSIVHFVNRYGEPHTLASYNDKFCTLHAMRPVYPANSQEEQLLASRGFVGKLKFAEQEVAALQQIYDQELLIDSSQSSDNLLERFKKGELLHYAGHARVSGDSAYLIWSDGQKLGLEELQLYYNPLRMVVLSACETGLGEWQYGEGVRSLGKAFRESGAQSVIMSLWSVNDGSTASIMKNFYEQLHKGVTKDAALHTAKLEYLQQADFEKKHPYYWAGFVGYGDMTSIAGGRNWVIYWVIILILTIVIPFFLSNKKA